MTAAALIAECDKMDEIEVGFVRLTLPAPANVGHRIRLAGRFGPVGDVVTFTSEGRVVATFETAAVRRFAKRIEHLTRQK